MRILKQTALLLAFAIAGGALGYVIAVRAERVKQLDTFYSFSSADARATAAALTLLRSGDTGKATRFLEGTLTGDLVSLGRYETDIPESLRHRDVYEGVAKVREYYARFPEATPSPYAAGGLALGTPAPHNAP